MQKQLPACQFLVSRAKPLQILNYRKAVIKLSAYRVSVGKFYRVSPVTVWDLITDTAKWPQWGPTVKKTKCSDRFIRKGSQGLVLTPLGIWLPFVITEYEDGRFWTWKVASIRATGHRVQAEQAGGCYLWFDMPMIAWPYIAICQMALNRIEDMLPMEHL